MHVLRSRILSVLFLFLMLVAPSLVPAADKEFRIVTTAELKAMMDGKQQFVLVDTRTPAEFQEAHIKGAISIPEKSFDSELAKLPSDKSALIVLYCNGVKCGKSKKAAKKADAAGYSNLIIYAEGFPVWEEKGLAITAGPDHDKMIETAKIKPADLDLLLRTKPNDVVVVDVRDASEFKEGHIPGAISLPVEIFASRSEILPKEKRIVVYCNSGGRSYNAYRKLMKLAYPDIAQALFADWKDAGMPVER